VEVLFIISIFVPFFLPLLLASFLIIMTLVGKISTEIGVHATAAKWFNLYATKLHHIQNLAEESMEPGCIVVMTGTTVSPLNNGLMS